VPRLSNITLSFPLHFPIPAHTPVCPPDDAMAAADTGDDDQRREFANSRASPDPLDEGKWWGDLPPLGALPALGTPPPMVTPPTTSRPLSPLGTSPTTSRPSSPLPVHFPSVDMVAGGDLGLAVAVDPPPPLSQPPTGSAGRRFLLAPGAAAGRKAGFPAPPLQHRGAAGRAGGAFSDGCGAPQPAPCAISDAAPGAAAGREAGSPAPPLQRGGAADGAGGAFTEGGGPPPPAPCAISDGAMGDCVGGDGRAVATLRSQTARVGLARAARQVNKQKRKNGPPV